MDWNRFSPRMFCAEIHSFSNFNLRNFESLKYEASSKTTSCSEPNHQRKRECSLNKLALSTLQPILQPIDVILAIRLNLCLSNYFKYRNRPRHKNSLWNTVRPLQQRGNDERTIRQEKNNNVIYVQIECRHQWKMLFGLSLNHFFQIDLYPGHSKLKKQNYLKRQHINNPLYNSYNHCY